MIQIKDIEINDRVVITSDCNSKGYEHDMGIIAKNIGKEVYYDCVKEEPETVEQVGELFGKLASGTAMKIVKSMLAV